MVEHRLPGWEVARQVPPRAAGAQDVEDRVEDDTQRVGWRPASFGLWRQMALEALPLRIGKIAWIISTHPSSLSYEVTFAISKTGSEIHKGAAGYPYASSRGKAAPFSTLCLKNGTKGVVSLPSHWKVNIIKYQSSSIHFREDT